MNPLLTTRTVVVSDHWAFTVSGKTACTRGGSKSTRTFDPRTVKFDLAADGIKESSARPLIAAPEMGHESTQLSHFTIPAFGVFIGSVH